ncbi:MAG: radical SAM protein [Thaumarchaeota archaeon]|nr:radical SAM protein [Nitrososphaerota archaeon]MDG6906488.1 radical SAM protein [Nitrososphaerota archaeon]
MCDMWKQEKTFISTEDAKRVIDMLHDNRFLAVYFTGGEPTLHPGLTEIVRYASSRGMFTSITTNGTSSKKLISDLKSSGLNLLSVSLDHWDDKICEEIRRFKEIKKKQESTIRHAREIGLKVYALSYLNPYLVRDGVEHMVEYVNKELLIPLGFCYPTESEANSYRLGGEIAGERVEVDVSKAVSSLLEMKECGHYSIANPHQYIADSLRFGRGEAPGRYCRGGQDVVYIDWNANVYPCFLKPKLFNVLEGGKPRFLDDVACNECAINCFREPSLLPQISTSPKMMLDEMRYSLKDTMKLVLAG